MASNTPLIRLRKATLELGGRTVWRDLDLEVKPGEFLAVLGPNGSGKTSLLRAMLGLNALSGGSVEVDGREPVRARGVVGYVPQQRSFDADLPVRGRDVVRFGYDGGRFGLPFGRFDADEPVQRAIREVGAEPYADKPVGLLSGGEQQRLRIAQAIVGNPKVLLCDEPLLSLDLSRQQAMTAVINKRREAGAAVVFVTHEINPILPLVDRVLYLVGGRWAIGKPPEVLTTERLSELYGAPVDVLHVRGRVVVVGSGEAALQEAGGHHHASGRRE